LTSAAAHGIFSTLRGSVAFFLLFMGLSADARAKEIIFGYGAHIVAERLKIVASCLILCGAFGLSSGLARPIAVDLTARDLRAGEFGLPLLDDTRDLSPSSTASALGESNANSNDEVAGMTQRWGYSQAEAK